MWVRWLLFPCGNCVQDIHIFSTEESALSDARSNRKYRSLGEGYRWAFLPAGEALENIRQLTSFACAPPDDDEAAERVRKAADQERAESVVLGDETPQPKSLEKTEWSPPKWAGAKAVDNE